MLFSLEEEDDGEDRGNVAAPSIAVVVAKKDNCGYFDTHCWTFI